MSDEIEAIKARLSALEQNVQEIRATISLLRAAEGQSMATLESIQRTLGGGPDLAEGTEGTGIKGQLAWVVAKLKQDEERRARKIKLLALVGTAVGIVGGVLGTVALVLGWFGG